VGGFLQSLAEAIARFEGFFSASSRAARNNNPGNLRERPANDKRGPLFPQYAKDAGGYVIFPDVETGWAALRNRLASSVAAGSSLRSLLSVFAPSGENPTESYIATVAGWLGIDPQRPLNEYASAQVGQAIASAEVPPSEEAGIATSDAVLGAALAFLALTLGLVLLK
jgi:hypothetical protein